MPLSIPGPSALFGAAGKGLDAVEQAVSLVPRLASVVTQVEDIVARVGLVVTDIEETSARALATVGRSETVVAAAAGLTGRLAPIVDEFEPSLRKVEPVLRRLAETTDPDEVDALVHVIDLMPQLVDKLTVDILPVIDTLGTVAPDLRDLLDVSKELNEMLGALPGLGRVKRRIEEQQDREDELRAAEDPPRAPDRRN